MSDDDERDPEDRDEAAAQDDADGLDESGVLPVIPAELAIDPLLASLLHCAAFLDLSDDDLVDPDAAVAALEHVGLYVGALAPGRVEELQAQLDRLATHGRAEGWPDDAVEFVQRFLYNCGVGDDDDDDDAPGDEADDDA